MNDWCILGGFLRVFVLEILIFKGLTARRLYKLFGVKGLRYLIYIDQINLLSKLRHTYLGSGYRSFAIANLGFNNFAVFLSTTSHLQFHLCKRVLLFPVRDPLVVIPSASITFFFSIFLLSARVFLSSSVVRFAPSPQKPRVFVRIASGV
jgi:hypothetical protein